LVWATVRSWCSSVLPWTPPLLVAASDSNDVGVEVQGEVDRRLRGRGTSCKEEARHKVRARLCVAMASASSSVNIYVFRCDVLTRYAEEGVPVAASASGEVAPRGGSETVPGDMIAAAMARLALGRA
jgi:hypothetical protein